MDLYDESEHVISSDEYSDDDNDDESLMNDAIRAQDDFYDRSKDYNHRNKQPKFEISQKQKELSSLIRKNKISIIYKNKSIRWLNSKKQREKYKELLYPNKDKQSVSLEKVDDANEAMEVEVQPVLVQGAVSAPKNDIASIKTIQDKQAENLEMEKTSDAYVEKENVEIQEIVETKENPDKLKEPNKGLEKEDLIPGKRKRSLTPEILNESADINQKNEKRSIKSPQFYKSVNDMFPTFDNIATDHINTVTNNTLTSVEEKMKSLLNEINALSEILNAKEMEWNRLLHLKTVKEEIYTRLRQKRQCLLVENYSKIEAGKKLEDLKELEFYLPTKKTVSSDESFSTISIQKLIEKRANMNAEDLEREKNNTSRLHSLLVSSNMLHGKESSGSFSPISNGNRANSFITSKNHDLLKQKDVFISKRGQQGDDKNVTAEFKKKKLEILPLTGKQNNLSNSELEQHNISIPLHNKKLSASQYLQTQRRSSLFPYGDSEEEILISPIGRLKKLSSRYENDSISAVNNHFNIMSEDNYFQHRAKTDFDGKLTKNIHYPLCQECKTNESRFVCAGCGNQWYCSKRCQVSAWDKHSDLCTE